jgi:hypothetical protein
MKIRYKHIFFLMLLLILLISSPVRNNLISQLETKPYSENTLAVIRQNGAAIHHYARKYSVSEIALTGALAGEINRRIFINSLIDYTQDQLYTSDLLDEKFLEFFLLSKVNSRYLNVSKQDVGLGNIKIQTAVEVFEKYPEEFPEITNYRQLLDYLLTDKGNIHIAALVIKEGEKAFGNYFFDSSKETRDAILITYYRQGDSYFSRYADNSGFNRAPIPGEGQRIRNNTHLLQHSLDY